MTKSERVRQQFKARFDGVLFDYSGETGKWIRDEKLTNQLADAAMIVWKLFEEQDKIIREGNEGFKNVQNGI